MANIIKSSSGLLFEEHFKGDISLVWDLAPNIPDRVVINSDSISLLPGIKQMELMIPTPKERGYVMQSKVEYTPSAASEKAGCILKSITDNSVELEICGDDIETCKYIKFGVDGDSILNAKASVDGEIWSDYGNTKVLDMNRIGYYIAPYALTDPFKIFNCIIYKNNNVIINNFDRKTIVRIYNAAGEEITDNFVIKKKNTQLVLDCTDMLFPIEYMKVKVFDRDANEVIHEGILEDVYGGDVFEYNYNVDFLIDQVTLTDKIHELGYVNDDNVFLLTIINKERYALSDKTLKVAAYTVFDPGYKLVEISEINVDNIDDFKSELKVNFTPGESKAFKLKITRNTEHVAFDQEYKFNIVLE